MPLTALPARLREQMASLHAVHDFGRDFPAPEAASSRGPEEGTRSEEGTRPEEPP